MCLWLLSNILPAWRFDDVVKEPLTKRTLFGSSLKNVRQGEVKFIFIGVLGGYFKYELLTVFA
jgi:hypothetical protein